jgi:putative transposase
VWTIDVEGLQYLAIVMDLFGRRIVGWHTSKRMTTDLIEQAFLTAYRLRRPPKGLVFHSDSTHNTQVSALERY